jgi:hypothetical protein
MKKLVYNTPHGQLTVRKNGEVTLRFENLYMQLNAKNFSEFVQFFNSNIHIAAGSPEEDSSDSFYHKVLKNMKKEYVSEFKKLINVPIYSPEDDFDIFDYLKMMKNKQIGVLSKEVETNLVKIDSDSICLN